VLDGQVGGSGPCNRLHDPVGVQCVCLSATLRVRDQVFSDAEVLEGMGACVHPVLLVAHVLCCVVLRPRRVCQGHWVHAAALHCQPPQVVKWCRAGARDSCAAPEQLHCHPDARYWQCAELLMLGALGGEMKREGQQWRHLSISHLRLSVAMKLVWVVPSLHCGRQGCLFVTLIREASKAHDGSQLVVSTSGLWELCGWPCQGQLLTNRLVMPCIM
jgi:hypothetical protein